MRTTSYDAGGGGASRGSANPPLVCRRVRIALIFSIMVAALGWGMAIAAAYEALEDMQARGEMDPTW
jgi:hypothetical protein